ncbi:MAG: flagellar protein FlgN [Ruminococcaceae bacterium]|nr:flagellar protein FlgN [Oscillospiraceae bacterium]
MAEIISDKVSDRIADIVINFLDGYNCHFEALVDFLTEKQNRILVDDLKWLEEALVDEQSFIMKGNSLEEKRLELFSQTGLKDKKLSDLPDCFPPQYAGVLKLQSDRLTKSIETIRRLNAVSKDLVERKLKVQAKLLGVSEFTGIGAYSGDAKIVKGSGSGDFLGSV